LHIFDYIAIDVAFAFAVSLFAAFVFDSLPLNRVRAVLRQRREVARRHRIPMLTIA
jgi:hypothetical protein